VGYSWSDAVDRFGALTIPRTWDQKHSITTGLAWRKSPWLLSAGASWHTGWRRNDVSVRGTGPEASIVLSGRNVLTWPDYFSLDLHGTWTHPLPKGALQVFAEVNNATNHANPCCTSFQLLDSQGEALLEHTTSVWVPRFALIGVTWELP
jgi:outer membrane receptor protein involved in Fe transport